jgi:O-antigen/teichoic acid export membrane protein
VTDQYSDGHRMGFFFKSFRSRRKIRPDGPAIAPLRILSVLVSPFVIGVGARMAVQVVAFAQIMIVARFIDIAGFGTYALGWACCVILVSLVYTGFYQALLRSPEFEDERDTGFWSMAIIGTGGAVLMGGVGLLLPGTESSLATVFLALAPILILRPLVAWNEVHLIRDRRVRLVSLYGLISECAALIVTWLCLTSGLGLFALVYGRYAALAIDFGFTQIAAGSFPALRFAGDAFGRLRLTALPLWGTSALGMSANYGADLILGAFMNTGAVGAFRGGARISQTAADLVFQPMNTIVWSRMTQMDKAGRHNELGSVWLENMGFGAVLLWPVLVSFGVLAEDLVVFLFDETWLPAAPVIVILCLSRGVGFLSFLLEPSMVCLGKGNTQLWVRAASLVAFLVALAAFGRFGAPQAAWAHVVLSVVSAVLSIAVIFPALQISARAAVKALLPAAALALVCFAGLIVSNGLRAELGPTPGLLAAIAGLVVVWTLMAGWYLKRGFVTLPRP